MCFWTWMICYHVVATMLPGVAGGFENHLSATWNYQILEFSVVKDDLEYLSQYEPDAAQIGWFIHRWQKRGSDGDDRRGERTTQEPRRETDQLHGQREHRCQKPVELHDAGLGCRGYPGKQDRRSGGHKLDFSEDFFSQRKERNENNIQPLEWSDGEFHFNDKR